MVHGVHIIVPFLNILNVIFDRFNWIKIETLKRKREITPHKTIYLYLFVFIDIYIYLFIKQKCSNGIDSCR